MNLDKTNEFRAELGGIKKIIDYCDKWQKRIEHQLEDDIWSENAEEELDIIKEMLGFCRKRLDEMNEEVNKSNITCEFYKWVHDPYDTSKQPPVYTSLCKVCKYEDCPHNPIDRKEE